ncbi:hypothetical protein WBG06_04730 [Nocardioides sp. CCNWLW239]|uniref:hypothetical protein n=1 Tax=Nocardioides sp. CCNWLW239 TaxID=3128902 RepID=UPI003019093D
MIRQEVLDLVRFGSLPSEDSSDKQIGEAETLLSRLPKLLSDEEANALVAVFGPDDCHGLAWTLLHLIETAPSAQSASYHGDDDDPWIRLLNDRVASIKSDDENRGRPSYP